MVIVDLITGFLGAGKTTFIQKYVKYLQSQNLQVRIIENEFGDVNMDTQLLAQEDLEVSDLTGLCMCCVGKDAFIQMLEESGKSACDRILVEPSGIYDVDEFFEVMSLPQIAACCEIGSILTIADPLSLCYMTEESEYLMFTQLLASGMVILSKTQMISEQTVEASIDHLNDLMRDKGCESGLMADICRKSWDDLTEEDYEAFMEIGYARFVHDREEFVHAEVFRSLQMDVVIQNKDQLQQAVMTLFSSPACGMVYRIKGYTKDLNRQWYEVNCTAETMSVKPVNVSGGSLVIIGQYLRKEEIRERLLF